MRRLAGSLKRELKSKHGIHPKVGHAYGELEVLVNGISVFSYKREHRIPTVDGLLALIEAAG
ncbi:MAG TPA: hypothetical protein VIH91_03725 [Terriglobales bacterium]